MTHQADVHFIKSKKEERSWHNLLCVNMTEFKQEVDLQQLMEISNSLGKAFE